MALAAHRPPLRSSGRRVPARALERRPTISVVVPCYRYGHHLPGAVASVLAQPGVDVEVIVIDDASPDGSADVGAALARSDDRVRFVAHERNHGHIATYNEGLGLATGDHVVLLSADDLLTPGSLGRAAALLDAHPEVGFVYGHPREFTDCPPPATTAVRDWTIWSGWSWLARRCEVGRNCIFCPEVVMRRSVQQEIGGYLPALPHSGDLQMWLRASAVADVGRINGADQGFYRIHDQSMQRTTFAGFARDLEERRAAFSSALLDRQHPVELGAMLYAQACRALAVAALDRVCWAYDAGVTEEEPVAVYVAFALEADPGIVRSAAWRAVQRRRRLGPQRCQRSVASRGRLAVRDLGDRVRWRRWRRIGV